VAGKKKLKRWTLLDVRLDTVSEVKKYAKNNGLTLSTALSQLIDNGIKKEQHNG